MRWLNLSAHRALGRLTHSSWQRLCPGGSAATTPGMEQGSHILHAVLLRLCWESIMFTTGSPPFNTMGACYRYNPRYGQPISVPKVWKCRHRRSVTPDEGKLQNLHLVWGGEKGFCFVLIIETLLYSAHFYGSFLSPMGNWFTGPPVRTLNCCWCRLYKMPSEY